MPHTVWNLGSLAASARLQAREFAAGIEPAQDVMIGRAREPKAMLLLQDAWIELNDFDVATEDFHQGKYSLALGKDPLTTALLLPVGSVATSSDTTTNPDAPVDVRQEFKAQGTSWAAKEVAIDFQESGALVVCDVDVHLDWEMVGVDWWTWFISWNRLELGPDGSLVDGERAYA